jgi:hypothetical protein
VCSRDRIDLLPARRRRLARACFAAERVFAMTKKFPSWLNGAPSYRANHKCQHYPGQKRSCDLRLSEMSPELQEYNGGLPRAIHPAQPRRLPLVRRVRLGRRAALTPAVESYHQWRVDPIPRPCQIWPSQFVQPHVFSKRRSRNERPGRRKR